MKNIVALLTVSFLSLCLCGCGRPRMFYAQPKNPPDHPIKTIALFPNGGFMAKAIGGELSSLGYDIVDSRAVSDLMVRNNLDESRILLPENLRILKDEGIDAYLFVTTFGGRDGFLQKATVRVNSTHNGELVSGVVWQNAWAGQEESVADRIIRKNIPQAAEQIAKRLAKELKRTKKAKVRDRKPAKKPTGPGETEDEKNTEENTDLKNRIPISTRVSSLPVLFGSFWRMAGRYL